MFKTKLLPGALVGVLALSVPLACGGGGKAAAEKESGGDHKKPGDTKKAGQADAAKVKSEPTGDVGEQSTRLTEEMGSLFEKHADNCDTLAKELEAFFTAKAEIFKKISEEGKKQTPEEKKAFDEKYKARLEAAMAKVSAAVSKCGDNAAVQAAMKNMPV